VQKKSLFINAGLVVLIILLGVFLYKQMDTYKQSMGQEEISSTGLMAQSPTDVPEMTDEVVENYSRRLGVTAPDFSLKSLDGEEVSLSDYLGTPVMINFWATWCPPCTAEMPLIDEFAEVYAGELVVLAVNAGEEKADVQEFIGAEEFHMVFLLDSSNAAAEKYFVYGYPASMFIDEEGLLQAIHIGELDEDGLAAYLSEIGVGK